MWPNLELANLIRKAPDSLTPLAPSFAVWVFSFKRHAAFLRIRVWRRGKTREGKDIRL
ncbi:hypothetical protein QG37_08015 [Candidozyma auris]|nr:hypothetical protein QG37_08015 [[Candida] auris]